MAAAAKTKVPLPDFDNEPDPLSGPARVAVIPDRTEIADVVAVCRATPPPPNVSVPPISKVPPPSVMVDESEITPAAVVWNAAPEDML